MNNRFLNQAFLSFLHRVVSTQMSPDLTMKVMVHESETYNKVGHDVYIVVHKTFKISLRSLTTSHSSTLSFISLFYKIIYFGE